MIAGTARAPMLRAVVCWSIALVAFLHAALASAFTPPPLTGPVVDEAGVLDASARTRIASKLQTYKGEVGPQIQVYVAKSLRDEPIADVAYDTARAWKLGDAERDDGILLLVAPAERKIRIETGQGVGGAVTDLQADGIIRTIISPRLKNGDYAGGIEGGVDALAKLLGAQSAPETKPQRAESSSVVAPVVMGIVLMLILIFAFRGRGGGGGGGGGGGDALSFLAGAFLGSQMRGGWSSGGGSWGGGGGGGSWGGGGGGFGGGGASGDY